jgi:hypothetical protein
MCIVVSLDKASHCPYVICAILCLTVNDLVLIMQSQWLHYVIYDLFRTGKNLSLQ